MLLSHAIAPLVPLAASASASVSAAPAQAASSHAAASAPAPDVAEAQPTKRIRVDSSGAAIGAASGGCGGGLSTPGARGTGSGCSAAMSSSCTNSDSAESQSQLSDPKQAAVAADPAAADSASVVVAAEAGAEAGAEAAGPFPLIKLCDFGFARPCACTEPWYAERHSSYVVTRFYRPPEVLLGDKYGAPVDVWSAGCTLAELATGRPLFPGGMRSRRRSPHGSPPPQTRDATLLTSSPNTPCINSLTPNIRPHAHARRRAGRSSMDQLWLILAALGPLPPRMAASLQSHTHLWPLAMELGPHHHQLAQQGAGSSAASSAGVAATVTAAAAEAQRAAERSNAVSSLSLLLRPVGWALVLGDVPVAHMHRTGVAHRHRLQWRA